MLAAGAQPLSYQWQLNGTNIVGATNSSFTLSGLTQELAGSLSVVVSNALGVSTSSVSTVTLAPPTTLPDFLWAQGGGGYGWDAGTAVAADPAGGVYVTGFYELWADFSGAWFAAKGGSAAHQRDMFIAKYDAAGSLLWIRVGASDFEDEGRGVAVDRSGNVYVTGLAGALGPGSTFEIGNTTLTNTDRFAAKFDSNGNPLWAIPAGGSTVAVDGAGNLYLAGNVTAPPFVIGTETLTNRGAFVAKYDGNGKAMWSRQSAGTYLVVGANLAVVGSNAVYLTGAFQNTAVFDGITLTNNSAGDAFFLAKYSDRGDFLWARQAGPAYTWNGPVLAADASGDCFWAGAFSGNLVVEGARATSLGEANTFLARFSADGALEWLQHLRGTNVVLGRTVCVDRFGNVILAGEFAGDVSFAGSGTPTLSPLGDPSLADVFLAWYDAHGNFRGVRQVGNPGLEGGFSLATAGSGRVYLAGAFGDMAWGGGGATITFGPATLSGHGGFDFYLATLDTLPPALGVRRTGDGIVLSWPAAATNYVIESAGSLSSPAWTAVTNMATSDLESIFLTLPLSDRQAFFRLRQP